MAALATTQIVQTGIAPTLAAAAGGGDTAIPDDRSYLHVNNASGGAITVTIAAFPDTSPWGAAIPDLVVSVGAGVARLIGPLSPAVFANPSTGVANITYSGVTSLTVGVFRV